MRSRRPLALILHHWRGPWPMRRWERRRLGAWRDTGLFTTAYANIAFPIDARDLATLSPDLVVLDATALAVRQMPGRQGGLIRALEALDATPAPRIAAPLDEFLANDALNRWLEQARVDRVYSPAQPSLWPLLYPRHAARGAVSPMLTAYLDPALQRAARRAPDVARRPIWLGYRTCEADPRFGRTGALKARIGQEAAAWAERRSLRADIRGAGDGVLLGEGWTRFLRRTRVTVAMEGGSDVLDRDGSLARAHQAGDLSWRAGPGHAPLGLRALSPRHIEAAACGAAQVLVEGDYSGVLSPAEHYLPVRPDLSDLEDALQACLDDERVRALTRRASLWITGSDRFTWARKLTDVRREMLG